MFWLYVLAYLVLGAFIVFRFGKLDRVASSSFKDDDNADLWIGVTVLFAVAIWPLVLALGLIRVIGMIAQRRGEAQS